MTTEVGKTIRTPAGGQPLGSGASEADIHDVVIVGAGPAGAVMAWSLARCGLRVAVLERARFPREKVCGDFVEPRGLRLFEAMGCEPELEAQHPLPITHVAIFLQSQVGYAGRIPFYETGTGLPPHGYIVPRHQLDTLLLDRARDVGADVYEDCPATEFAREDKGVTVWARRGSRRSRFRARLVVGADGTSSIVARHFGLFRNDPRYIAVSQRAYVEGTSMDVGEASFFFDTDLFPGYGWMFPIAGGRANIGVGVLKESCNRFGISVPSLFQEFLQKLKRQHSGCARMKILGKPVGGIVKTYGGAGPNCFDGGLLVGDAGCFVDPMTGEGITLAAESAMIASSTVAEAVRSGRSDAVFLSRFERDFRQYFDPAMRYLDFCATIMRNRHLREFWLSVALRGCEEAARNPEFARVVGSTFGGMEVLPSAILMRIWVNTLKEISSDGGRMLLKLLSGKIDWPGGTMNDIGGLSRGWWQSLIADPLWHSAWTADVLQKWARLLETFMLSDDPRLQGPLGPNSNPLTTCDP